MTGTGKRALGAIALAMGVSCQIWAFQAWAADPVKIGMITTLSGPGGYLGEEVRDGFQLAIDQEGGKLGGVPVTVEVADDGLKPGNAKDIAQRMLGSEHIKLMTGIIFSNVAGATVPDILDAGAFYISPNAAPSNFAGKDCHKNYFVVPWQNDSLHESAGEDANNLGYKKMFILAPNYQAGKDALAGFKRAYKGQVVGEVYTKLDQTDFAPELAQIRDAKPDAVFQFEPGGLGITFLKQYVQAGLMEKIPMVVSSPSMDARTLDAVGDAALGVQVSSFWNSDFDNPASKAFVAAYEAKFHRTPTYYAAQGYDTARLVASALRAVGGDLAKADAFRAALRQADFQSVRGAFKFGQNQHPIEDWYALKVVKGADGKPVLKTMGKIFEAHGDAYAAECKM
ncbi:ABC transporter substrate-binding protein [Aliidongia dinghuensis]|uniref:ABC transporter substrate-binding protein n=1 Tax=Aliidongia dinghuensis TaxID=1867774 RepID=A0A8J2YYB3_9PROT|nr:ABC transporter substrate-binding protein [Aliidongia dinghuensis]GGF36453.1 ABC transporter substrate-binding protein [Aliidongia dinghuensis]